MTTKKDKIDFEYTNELLNFKPIFGDMRHIQIVWVAKEIARCEGVKKSPKILNKIMELKKNVIWLIKTDF